MADGLQHIGGLLPHPQTSLPAPGSEEEPEDACLLCHGAGFIHPRLASGAPDYSRTVPCDCRLWEMEQRKRAYLLAKCELPPGTEGLTFEQFETRPGTETAFEAALSLARGGANAIRWLTLVAPPDRGKTHLAIAICREWLSRGMPALYAYVPIMLDDLRSGYHRGDADQRFEFYCEVPLLVLDDLGVESATPWVNERLDTIVDYRYIRRLPLIITTNKRADELPVRIRSRVMRATFGLAVTIEADEYRLWGKP